MSKTVVAYKSTYGTSKQYAQWISKELNADLMDYKKVSLPELLKYDIIIFGGGIYMGGISGAELISNNIRQLSEKILVVFSVGFTPLKRIDILNKVISKNFDDEQKEFIKFYHFPGSIDYTKLNFIHKTALAAKKISMSRKSDKQLTKANKEFLENYGKGAHDLSMEDVKPLIDFVKKQYVELIK